MVLTILVLYVAFINMYNVIEHGDEYNYHVDVILATIHQIMH